MCTPREGQVLGFVSACPFWGFRNMFSFQVHLRGLAQERLPHGVGVFWKGSVGSVGQLHRLSKVGRSLRGHGKEAAPQKSRPIRSRNHAFVGRLSLIKSTALVAKIPPIPPPVSARASEVRTLAPATPSDPAPLSGGIARSYHRLPRSGNSATRRPLPDFYALDLPQPSSRGIVCSTGYVSTKPASTTRRIRAVVDRRSPLRRSNLFSVLLFVVFHLRSEKSIRAISR